MKTQRQRIALWAWEMVRNQGFTFSQAMKQAWKMVKLRDLENALPSKQIRVSFFKVDGTKTTRLATRNAKFIPQDQRPKGSGRGKADNVITFFSLSDGGWRSFRAENLIGYQVA